MAKKGKADEQPGDDIDLKPISQAAYARARDVTPQYINKLVKADKIPLHKGKIIPAEADRILSDNADPSKEHRTKGNQPDNGLAGSNSSGGESGDDYNDHKIIETLKAEFSREEIKVLERAIQKIPTWNMGQRLQANLKALNESMTYEKERGNLVDAKLTEQTWTDKLSMFRAKILTVPKKMLSALSALVLKYAAKMGQALFDSAARIRKKGKGPGWIYDKKTDELVLLAGKNKRPFVKLPLSLEAPDHAEAMAMVDIEQALTKEVHEALTELSGGKNE